MSCAAGLPRRATHGHAVAFYEPPPGGLFVGETMQPGQRFVLGAHEASDALAAYAMLRPNTEVPPALGAAYTRALRATESTSLDTHGVIGSQEMASTGLSLQTLTSSSSAANFVNSDGGCDWGPQGTFCRVNWSNGFWASMSPTASGLCIVDHYAGNGITVEITVGTMITSPFQAVGTIAQWSLGAAGPATTRRIDITNASGDSFHVGCRWGVRSARWASPLSSPGRRLRGALMSVIERTQRGRATRPEH